MAALIGSDNSKTLLRAAGTKLQTVNIDTGVCTNVSSDTATPTSDFFTSTSTQPVVFANFIKPDVDTIWCCGAGSTSLLGYNGTSVTTNGVAAPTGTFTAVVSLLGGAFASTGTYYYAIALRKASTQAESNAALDQVAVIANTTDKVTLTFPTGVDSTKYDKWIVYRSAVGGASAFTTGDRVAEVTVGTATYVDTGTSLTSSDVVPRTGNVVLDNGVLPSGTYKTVTVFKNMLVTAQGNTIYFSDPDKPESWPEFKTVTLPTGGDIKALGIVAFNTDTTSNADEFLMVFSEKSFHIVIGSGDYDADFNYYDFFLKYVDDIGCVGQSTIVNGAGFAAWVDNAGIYMWDGAGRPEYVSRPIEALFASDGLIDKSKIGQCFGRFYRKQKQIIWFISHKTKGENKIALKLDMRLTVPRAGNGMVEGVFSTDTQLSLYGGVSYIPTSNGDEIFFAGDGDGNIYKLYLVGSDNGTAIDFSYVTKALEMGEPGHAKRFHKVVAWVDRLGPWDLTLDYWADYKVAEADRSTISESMSLLPNTTVGSLWDLAVWDSSFWDDYEQQMSGLVFNLNGKENNSDGDSIKLRFSQSGVNNPVTLYGFSIYYSDLSERK